MASASSTPTTTVMATETAAVEEPKREEMVHRTKRIKFLDRTTPIILQNDNGPCPLIAICNVLLLKKSLNLPDISEVSQEKLLSLVAERLIDSNSNVNNKDAGYVENQQQNISDAIDLLPRLATGIDVNIKFRRIDDFEFTPECAIFDLLDIPLYHGWIVDPQDQDTANAIGSKSYNTLMGELVALETQNMGSDHQKSLEDDSVDFAAATTAALGVPSPCLSRGISFDEPPVSVTEHHSPIPVPDLDISRKGDLLEEAELMRALQLSEAEVVTPSVEVVSMDEASSLMRPQESTHVRISESHVLAEATEVIAYSKNEETLEHEASTTHDSRVLCSNNDDQRCIETSSENAVCSSGKPDQDNLILQSTSAESNTVVEEPGSDSHVKNESTPLESRQDNSTASGSCGHMPSEDKVQSHSTIVSDLHDVENKQDGSDTLASSCSTSVVVDEPEALTSNIDGSEPLYEGEDSILESGTTTYQNQEPVYEGEVVLLEQVDKGTTARDTNSRCEMTREQGDLIRNFLKNSASQLTIHGLFCLQDGIGENQLCVFFRNNHFNTLFKFKGELYILVTDQGYLNQPDLVWEKLNEVNGDTLFMTGIFEEFKVDSQANSSIWDEQKAVSSTADYLANIDTSVQEDSSFNSDWQLAMALQQQEFEQQQTQRNNNPQQGVSATSGLVIGPQVTRNSEKHTSSSSKQELKASKDKCTVM